ncbi:MAG TPA: cupredoxin domain-containing protein [Actinomycetota bacterium]|nr:cupredoxin domain-containing protein [Actinomycetota bacterium]
MPGLPGFRRWASFGVAALAAALLAVSCAPVEDQPDVPVTVRTEFVAYVPDSAFDAGRSASVALDAEGNPSVAYLLYQPVLREGEIPPAVVAGEPQPPAVMLATFRQDVWSRTSVTPQGGVGEEARGLAPEIANREGQAIPGVTAAVAVDGQGNHHVVWSTPRGLFYATDGGGQGFGEPQELTSQASLGASVAVGPDGPLVAYYVANEVRLSTRRGDSWATETVARLGRRAEDPALATAVGVSGGEPVVAYGEDGSTRVARRAGGAWASEAVPGPGGFALSMAVDADGNPHLAYLDAEGGVHQAHSVGGGPWEVADLGTTGRPLSEAREVPVGTSVAVDGEGRHYVAWGRLDAPSVEVVTDAGGSYQPLTLGTPVEGGADPSLAVSQDGTRLVVAWYDTRNGDLVVATPAGEELVLAFSPGPREVPTAGPPPAECEPEPGVTELTITAPAGASVSGFDTKCLAVEAGQPFTVTFRNDDAGVPHNWALYESQDAAQANQPSIGGAPSAAETITGPAETTYEVEALEPGQYFYRCDVHPVTMTGTLVVAEAGGGGGG